MKSWLSCSRLIIGLSAVLSLFIACNKEYTSPYGYDYIKVYKYNKEPWDSDAEKNKIYITELSDQDSILYPKIGTLNFTLIDSLKPSWKTDSLFFKGKYEEYSPRPNCPAGNNHILLFYKGSDLKYVAKFSIYCDECFLINHTTRETHYIKVGYDKIMKLISPASH